MTESEEIIIDEGIPIPPKRKRWSKYIKLLDTMEIGESFEIGSTYAVQNFYHLSIRNGKRVRSKKLPNGKFRVWRIK